MGLDRERGKRGEILDGTLRIFMGQGLGGLTMEGLAARLRVSKRTLYKYFPNRTALLEAALARQFESVYAAISAVRDDPTKDFPTKMRDALEVVAGVINRLASPLLTELGTTAPELWEGVDRFRRTKIFPAFGQILKEGVDAGYVRDDIDERYFAPILFTCISAVASPHQLALLRVWPGEAFNATIRMLFGGILTDAGRRGLQRPLETVFLESDHKESLHT